MANDEHKKLAQYLKDVHLSLRQSSALVGAERAWQDHCKNSEKLRVYAQKMEKLATTFWAENCLDGLSQATSRIKWAADFSYDYFVNDGYLYHNIKEIEIGKKINVLIINELLHSDVIKLLDVGSCYNPFNVYDFIDVLAIDLCPANDTVMQCDFLNVLTGCKTIVQNSTVQQLREENFDVITFCFLLEYIPSSELRIKACKTAYQLLQPGGLLLISTPDSKHVGANCKLMKCWRYTLACIGFSRIKYEKFKHMHCMAFRKSLNKEVAIRWAHLHKEVYMDFNLYIPQDFKIKKNKYDTTYTAEVAVEDFMELPFFDDSL